MKVTDIIHNLYTGGLPAVVEENAMKPLRLDIQFFADPEEPDEPDPDEPDEPDDEDFDLDELLKDPKVKAAYEAKLQTQIGRRLKKYKDIDVAEYKALKAAAEKAGNKDKKETPDDDATQAANEKLAKIEKREKKAEIKLFATKAEVDPFLFEKFVNFDDIELNDDGEAENLDELLDELRDDPKTAKYFAAVETDDEEEDDKSSKKKTFNPGNKQKTNKQKKVDPYEAGRQKALARQKKKEDKS